MSRIKWNPCDPCHPWFIISPNSFQCLAHLTPLNRPGGSTKQASLPRPSVLMSKSSKAMVEIRKSVFERMTVEVSKRLNGGKAGHVVVPVSPGELIDKLAILVIKSER